jgi:RNA-directed DNA polymerase
MIKTSITLQELRRKIYIKAKAEPTHRFWGLYVHVCKMETLREAYQLVKANNGVPGIDGVSIEQIEQTGREPFLQEIQASLKDGSYQPQRNRIKEIPKANGKMRTLGISTIRDRVVQAALKLILEPVFEADFQEGSYGYRPKRTAHQAIKRVAQAVVEQKTRVIDLDLKAYFDNVKHSILLDKIAGRVNDDQVLHLLKLMLKTGGKMGVPQGSVLSPLLSNIYLNEVDKMLEKAKEVTKQQGKYYQLEYARWADDLIILVNRHPNNDRLWEKVKQRLREELDKLQVPINEEKTKFLDLDKAETFGFLGFEYRKVRTRKGKMGVLYQPRKQAKEKLMEKIREVFRRYVSQPLTKVRDIINPILRGWANYFRVGNSAQTFADVKRWLELKMRRHLMRAKKKKGYGWKRWSTRGLFAMYNIYSDFKVTSWKVSPAC